MFFVRSEYLAKFTKALGTGQYLLRSVEETMARPVAGYLKIHKTWFETAPLPV
jgi:hypothetical protein